MHAVVTLWGEMARCPLTCRKIVGLHHRNSHSPPPICSCAATTSNRMTSCFSSYSSIKLNRRNSFPSKRNSLLARCHATGPQSEPPSEKHLSPISGTISLLFDILIVAFNFDFDHLVLPVSFSIAI